MNKKFVEKIVKSVLEGKKFSEAVVSEGVGDWLKTAAGYWGSKLGSKGAEDLWKSQIDKSRKDPLYQMLPAIWMYGRQWINYSPENLALVAEQSLDDNQALSLAIFTLASPYLAEDDKVPIMQTLLNNQAVSPQIKVNIVSMVSDAPADALSPDVKQQILAVPSTI